MWLVIIWMFLSRCFRTHWNQMLKLTFIWRAYSTRVLQISKIQFYSLLKLCWYCGFFILSFLLKSLQILFRYFHSLNEVITSVFLLEIFISYWAQHVIYYWIFVLVLFATTAARREASASFFDRRLFILHLSIIRYILT